MSRKSVRIDFDFAADVLVTFKCGACGTIATERYFCTMQGLSVNCDPPAGWTVTPWHELVCDKHRVVVVDKEDGA